MPCIIFLMFDCMKNANTNNHIQFILPMLNGNININEETDVSYSEPNSSDQHEIEKLPKKDRKEIYGKGNEAQTIKNEIGDFDAYKSSTYIQIIGLFGKSVRFTELLGIINSLQIYLSLKKNIHLPQTTRNEKRSFPLLIKYIERNSDFILPYLKYFSLCDSSFHKIPLDIST